MLSLTSGSSCDICFERFGQDRKAPTSIACGHVFCNACISQITRLCPLCRTPFDQRTCIKLHVDLESEQPGCSAEDMQRAQKLQQSIASIADDGISEPNLRQLIQEGKTFLHSQPRQLHKDLRVAHRMISYLCEVKATLRSQKQAVEMLTDQIKQLTQEKADLRGQIAQLEEARRYERETAEAVEKSLRDHYDEAVNVYHSTIRLYNQVAQQNSELMLKLSNQLAPAKHTEQRNSGSIAPTPSTITSLLSPAVDQKALSGIAIPDPHSSFLISPLPQFTSNLPSIADSFVPLPDLAEDDEGEGESTEDEEEELSTPDSGRHQPQLREHKDRLAAPTVPLGPFRSEGRFGQEPSGLSRTAPYLEHRRARSSSNPSQPTSRSQSRSRSPFDSIASSTPPRSPLPNYTATIQPQPQPATSRDVYPSSSSQTTFQPPQDRQVLRSRLQDILSDSATSSSLPNMNSYFPASFTSRDADTRSGRVSPPPSRTDSSNSSNSSNSTSKTPVPPQQSSDGFSHLLASGSAAFPNKPTPSGTPTVGLRISTASAEAKKLEEERKRRHKEEKYGQGQEYDRHPVEPDRDARWSKTSSAPTAPSTTTQPPRRDQQRYADPLPSNTSSTTSSLKRGPSTSNSGTYGRSSGGSPPHEQGAGHQSRHSQSTSSTATTKASTKNNGPMLPSNPSGIYT